MNTTTAVVVMPMFNRMLEGLFIYTVGGTVGRGLTES